MFKKEIISLNKVLSKISGLYQIWFQNKQVNLFMTRAMTALYLGKELSQKEISEAYQIPRQTINNAVKRLEKDGHIELIPDEKDKRYKKIRFTDSGRLVAQKHLTPFFELDERVMQRMGSEKHAQFVSLLEDYAELLEDEIKKDTMN